MMALAVTGMDARMTSTHPQLPTCAHARRLQHHGLCFRLRCSHPSLISCGKGDNKLSWPTCCGVGDFNLSLFPILDVGWLELQVPRSLATQTAEDMKDLQIPSRQSFGTPKQRHFKLLGQNCQFKGPSRRIEGIYTQTMNTIPIM